MSGMVAAWRCGACNINWYGHVQFRVCASCGEACYSMVMNRDDILTYDESRAHANELAREAERLAALAEQEAVLAQATADRVASAASAALLHDADTEWLSASPEALAAWTGEAAC